MKAIYKSKKFWVFTFDNNFLYENYSNDKKIKIRKIVTDLPPKSKLSDDKISFLFRYYDENDKITHTI
jgi:hypothetical protein